FLFFSPMDKPFARHFGSSILPGLLRFLQPKRACGLLAAAFTALSWAVPASSPQLIPKPVPAARTELPTAFAKSTPTSAADLKSMEEHLKALAARVSPAVVAVEVGLGSGSGVVITAD